MNPNRFRCPACRTRRTSFIKLIEHCAAKKHTLCTCGGYHFAHRPGSPTCVENPMSDVHVALRGSGVTEDELLEIEMHCVWEKPGRPFNEWRD